MHQTSFLYLANALIGLNLRVASVNFVQESFECKNCLTFETGSLLAFARFRTEPYAAGSCVYSL